MCPGEMRNLAPACLNGLGAAYLSGGISAVSAQCVEHRHKYRSMNTVMNAIPSSYAAHVLLGLLQLLTIEDVWSKLEEKISVQLFMQCHMRAIEMFRFQTVPPPHSSDFLPFFFFFFSKPQCFGWKTHNDMQTVLLCQKSPDAVAACILCMLTPHKRQGQQLTCLLWPSLSTRLILCGWCVGVE